MSGQDDPYSGVPQPGGWTLDEKGQPMIVVQGGGGGDAQAAAAAVARRSAALMWMGAMLGSSLIASLFLLWLYVEARGDAATARTQLQTETARLETELNRTKEQLTVMTERARTFERDNQDLLKENNQFRTARRLPPRPAPSPRNPDPFGGNR